MWELIADRLVAEHQALRLPPLTEREVRLPLLPGKADAIVGMRRSGKTWRVLQLLQELERGGLPRSQSLYVNLEDERLRGAGVELLTALVEAAFRRDPAAAERPFWLMLDEPQLVPGWEVFVRRMLDTRTTRVVVTGSSARLLSREVATSLRGRSLTTEILPFSFREALTHAGLAPPGRKAPAAKGRAELERACLRYLETGGFPEVQALAPLLRRRVLQEYVDVTLFRDVVERHQATNVVALRRLVSHLLHAPSGMLSVHKLYNDLRSQGVAVGKDALHEYLGHLEDAFFVFSVAIDARSARQRAVHPRKMFLVDPALAQVATVAPGAGVQGHVLENVVYLELRRRGAEVSYQSSSSGSMIDFVARHHDGRVELIQVCADADSADTMVREVSSLEEIAPRYPGALLSMVTLHSEGTFSVGRRKARMVPAWRFLSEGFP